MECAFLPHRICRETWIFWRIKTCLFEPVFLKFRIFNLRISDTFDFIERYSWFTLVLRVQPSQKMSKYGITQNSIFRHFLMKHFWLEINFTGLFFFFRIWREFSSESF